MPRSTPKPTSPKKTGMKMTRICTAVAPRWDLRPPPLQAGLDFVLRYFMSTGSYKFGLLSGLGLGFTLALGRRLGFLLAYGWHVWLDGLRQRCRFSGRERFYEARGYYHQQLIRCLFRGIAAEQLAQDRNVAEAFDLVYKIGDAIVDESGDGEALAILEHHLRF